MTRYNPDHYIVEVHIGIDVLHRDYGSEEGPARRAYNRLKRFNFDDVRVWHDKHTINFEESSDAPRT